MTPPGTPVIATSPSPRRRVTARWWLAGLLVGCLLPGALAQNESLRLVERLTQHCLIASRAVRAHSRRIAKRIVWHVPRARHRKCHVPTSFLRRPVSWRPCADHDVLNRRGPPA
ncbi:hypothetical protein ACPF7Z_02290 [Halomonas sp. GXIMD04776]